SRVVEAVAAAAATTAAIATQTETAGGIAADTAVPADRVGRVAGKTAGATAARDATQRCTTSAACTAIAIGEAVLPGSDVGTAGPADAVRAAASARTTAGSCAAQRGTVVATRSVSKGGTSKKLEDRHRGEQQPTHGETLRALHRLSGLFPSQWKSATCHSV